MGHVTLAGVAARAGVSVSTASLVFSGRGPVSDATRTRVERAAAELGYAGPNPMAASLRRGRTGVVGVLVGDRLIDAFRDPVSVATLDGISQVLDDHRMGVLLLPGAPGADPSVADRAARFPIDAAIFGGHGAENDPAVAAFRARGIPMVGIEGPHVPDVPLVDIDHRKASRELAKLVRKAGHRDVGVVTLPLDPDPAEGPPAAARARRGRFRDATQRLAGVRDVFGAVRVWEAPRHRLDDGRRAGIALLTDDQSTPTAILAQSDLLAAGIIRAAADLGLRVPHDLSVVGFDGIETPWLDQELTTAVQPMIDKGRVAAEMVCTLLDGGRPDNVVLPVEVRTGGTLAPPATRRLDPGTD